MWLECIYYQKTFHEIVLYSPDLNLFYNILHRLYYHISDSRLKAIFSKIAYCLQTYNYNRNYMWALIENDIWFLATYKNIHFAPLLDDIIQILQV